MNTEKQFDDIVSVCSSMFIKKNHDYGAAWRILRPSSLTDQIYIKVNRIRTLQINGVSKVGESIEDEFIAIVNYSVMGIIQLQKGFVDEIDISSDEAIHLYDNYINESKQLMIKKNHDYGEAWRKMRVSSITDLILQKIHRTKQIEDNDGSTLVSEGIDANYYDMLNYAVFCLIKLQENEK